MSDDSLEMQVRLYSQIFDFIPEQIAVIDTKYQFIFTNQSYLDFHSQTSENLIGETLEKLVGTDIFKFVMKPKIDACYAGEEVSYRNWIKFESAGHKYMEVSYGTLHDIYDRVVAIAIHYRDLTEQKKLELSLEESRQIIGQINTTDWLTDLHNKMHFDDTFPKMINISKRNNHLLAFALIDVDNFDEYNRHYGRSSGDSALVKVASTFKKHLRRPNDYMFRFDKDVFAILFNVTQSDDAISIATNILHSIQALKIEHFYSPTLPYLSVSIGLGILKPDQNYPKNEIYKKVSDLLSSAKMKGKNQIAAGTFNLISRGPIS